MGAYLRVRGVDAAEKGPSVRAIRTPDGRQLPPDIALHRAGWWVAVGRCSCLFRAPRRHYRADVWTRPQRRRLGEFAYGPYFCRPSRCDALSEAVAYIQNILRASPGGYWARRAKRAGVPADLVDAWVYTSAWMRRAAPIRGIAAIGEYLVYSATRYDEGDGVVSYRFAAPHRRLFVLVPPPGLDIPPMLGGEDDVWWFRRQVREARRAAERAARLAAEPTLMAQPIIGWRAWDVDVDGRLVSPVQRTVWPVGRPLVAMCGDEPVERVEPDAGIYAVRDVLDIAGKVIGKVALWGSVLECEDGWVAQYAYPYALPEEWARIYGCEVLDTEKASA
jgi:hypothetical protein